MTAIFLGTSTIRTDKPLKDFNIRVQSQYKRKATERNPYADHYSQ
jgi:hypothetical protein